MKELFDKKQAYSKEDIAAIEYSQLKGIMGVRTVEAVEAAMTYANYLNSIGITSSNYPIFLKVLGVRNHHVIDSLLGTRDPFLFLSSIQPNYFIVATCFSFLAKYHPAEIYSKTLGIILGVFQATYSNPLDGYKIYPPTIADVNSLGKHLIEEKGQDDLLNRSILDVLDKLSELEGQNIDEEMEDLAVHAHNIRNNFFDSTKRLVDVIPDVLLKTEPNLDLEINPRKNGSLSENTKPQARATPAAKPEEEKPAATKKK
ncbi:hypothetical protein [Sediminispirochaeta smaragdinae]|jgi:hypothetical protein|uniref:Uncharacterized protein n=1 Tax=Sediminispirochaeta smaragdinae (strain DSM 11293 / JCM 15392 / SEBR 4228) TaxID=573413 RepID=E1RCB7_SEDSS|nr:hypothetical protein [Sediminispirochaeta smaragdinae]ADK79997.1 hypothetical protein Spirs_0863 [Sediminispirochaeta smaragdinae DSM 11293]